MPYRSPIAKPGQVLALLCVAVGVPSTRAQVIDLANAVGVFQIQADEVNDDFGAGSVACDLDGDGLDELSVGAEEADGPSNTRPVAGEVFVFSGRRDSWSGSTTASNLRRVWIIGGDVGDTLGFAPMLCGNFNGDTRNDLVVGAHQADSVGNARSQAGQTHLLLGASSWPSVIDLNTSPGTIMYGARPDDLIGLGQAAGDINGDGIQDLIEGAYKSNSLSNLQTAAGRVHIVFGRTSWPATIDLETADDVTIWGTKTNDFLGSNQFADDINGDGTADLFVGAPFADGQNDSRMDAGDVNVFFGRANWPSTINLATTAPDMLLFGADIDDRAGDGAGILVSDLDADGSIEIVVGHRTGDGPFNDRPQAGEVRLFEPRGSFPTVVDFRLRTDNVIYAKSIEDRACNIVQTADVNGDGYSDLLCSASLADGPDETRSMAGEIFVVFGGPNFPVNRDLATSSPDLIVYGVAPNDQLKLLTTPDVNGDGLAEIAASSGLFSSTVPSTVWLISPFDIDGDGIQQLPDNCPLVANPNQLDSDGDLRGDACALDWDGDGLNDASDCAINNKRGGKPSEISGVTLSSSSSTQIDWNASMLSDAYDISRGLLSQRSATNYGSCQNTRDADLTDTRFTDDQLTPAGDGFFYLIRGRDAACPAIGTWGNRSDGSERVNTAVGGC